MAFLRERTPNITKGESSSIVFEAGVSQGYKDAMDMLSLVISEQPVKDIDYDNR